MIPIITVLADPTLKPSARWVRHCLLNLYQLDEYKNV
jgi:hypothetical protein